jgi:hypothetical protein
LRLIPGSDSHVFEHTAAEDVFDHPLAVRCGDRTIHCQYRRDGNTHAARRQDQCGERDTFAVEAERKPKWCDLLGGSNRLRQGRGGLAEAFAEAEDRPLPTGLSAVLLVEAGL